MTKDQEIENLKKTDAFYERHSQLHDYSNAGSSRSLDQSRDKQQQSPQSRKEF